MNEEPQNIEIGDNRSELGLRLRRARELAGLSQGQAAKLMQMHRPTISEIEAGRRRVAVEELAQFANIYDANISWLTHGAEDGVMSDSRYQIAARELTKLKPADIDRLLELLHVLKGAGGDPS